MCTVTFLPRKEGFILTSSRDEIASRGNTDFPISKVVDGQTIIFPQDPLKGGTWLAMGENGRVCCLLNGAFEKHKHLPPYAKSRGVVLLDAFKYEKFGDFAENYEFENVEPFTLICAEFGPKSMLFEFRWDGENRFFTVLDAQSPRIWSSATLYSKPQRLIRENWFNEWFNESLFTEKEGFEFHENGGGGDHENGIKMKRRIGPETVSISQISQKTKGIEFKHLNFVSGRDTTHVIPLESIRNAR